ncbi:unnamed protein product [Durusdinium trenchii]|uniref:Cation efflux protein transmembrane domain-containing protein n=1 Tax=Durusdinium trenchii TaxID=1381693 RepID=A0ABP0PAW8_9DINO
MASETTSTTSSPVEVEEDLHEMVDPGLSRGIVVYDMVEEQVKADEEELFDRMEPSKAKYFTPEVKALFISASLYTLITSAQVYAAHVSHSQALLMDCISSFVDAFTFMGNIVVECQKRDGKSHVDLATDADDVNGWITLGFALGNILFDMICLRNFYRSHKQTGCARHVNMFSAFLHVSADLLRACTTLVMSLLVLISPDLNSSCADASSSIFIGFTILGGASVGFYKWLKLLIRSCSSDGGLCSRLW